MANNWLSNRLAEPSTRIGLTMVAAIITKVAANPPQNQAAWTELAIASVGSLLAVFTKAPGSPDAPPVPVPQPS